MTMNLSTSSPRVLSDVAASTAIRRAVLVIGGSVFVGLAAQLSIPLPFTPVPLTGQTLAVLLTGAALGSRRGLASMALYAALGAVGLPWFAGGSSGVYAPSFGYILGFVLAAFVVGLVAERGWTRTPLRTAIVMVLGNVVIYAVGVTYLKIALGVSWGHALSLGFVPFLIGDAVKIAIAAGLFSTAWRMVSKFERSND